ncbi:MAG: lysine--tRNA ligase [Euryarchaeota archaeon]|nr:lysine--tRNA ligase [Euryarchaeota archaeon]
MHWADVIARQLLERRPDHVLATAITPSGPIHVGNMREVLTSEAVHRAIQDQGGESEFIYIADSYDPLRKVYPFLDESAYAPHVGRPLAEIPCPCGGHATYAEHFLEPFLAALFDMGITPRVLDAHMMYKDGAYQETILRALAATDRVREIIERVSKRQLPKGWIPFNVQCQDKSCGSLDTTPLAYIHPIVTYRCKRCDLEAEVDITRPGVGKLPWRIDWPARWSFLGVTFEAAGKDHHASGGSWDTGQEIARTVFDTEPPMGLLYEFIQLKGKGAMHSSTGTTVSAEDMLRITPPEVLRFLIVRNDPRKHIDFDPGLGILNLVEDYDRFERVHYGKEEEGTGIKDAERVYALSQPHRVRAQMPVQVSYRHLVTVVQMAESDDDVIHILARAGEIPSDLPDADRKHILERAAHVREWLARFAPEDVKFQVQKEPPVFPTDADDRMLYSRFVDVLESVAEWRGDKIHDAVYEALTDLGLKAGEGFRAVYRAILGKDRGPRAGHFLASLPRDWVVERFRHYAGEEATTGTQERA